LFIRFTQFRMRDHRASILFTVQHCISDFALDQMRL
jgi:hypothetical protein